MKQIDLSNTLFGNIRSFTENDQIYFVASDVAKALGYGKPANAIADHCQENVQINGTPFPGTLNLKDANGRTHDYRIIDEPNLYRLIFGSTLESAKDFTEWVFSEVLPPIRKYGAYPKPENAKEPKQLENKVAELQAELDARPTKVVGMSSRADRTKLHQMREDLHMLGVCDKRIEVVRHYYYPVNDHGELMGYRDKPGTTGKTATIDVNYRMIEKD